MQNGKGDSPRKKSVSQEVWDRNWEKIFRPKNVKKENCKSRQEKHEEKSEQKENSYTRTAFW